MESKSWTAAAILALAVPLGAAAQDEAACLAYADSAMFVIDDAARSGCGFTGPRWAADFDAHYGFCMGLGPEGGLAAAIETNQRGRDMAACWARGNGTEAFQPRTAFENASQAFPLTLSTLCQNYADTTSQQVQYNLSLGCGFADDGGRWAQSYNAHRDACLGGFGGQNIGRTAAAEINGRYWDLKECQVRLAPVGTPVEETPPPGFSHVITDDVDVYDQPGENVISTLAGGTQVNAACRADNWCEVAGEGWAWGDFVQPQ